jgi:DNA-binding MarR family transcriptional regulator
LAELGNEWSSAIRQTAQYDVIAENLGMVVMCRLAREDRLRPVQLQESLAITSGGVSKLLDRLEAAGVVARLGTKPEDDLRGVEIVLTRKGSSVLGDVLSAIAPSAAAVVGELQRIAAESGVSIGTATSTED